MNANPISTVGLMLTLAGLVGSFFNIQLSQWLRDLMALAQKTRMNRRHATTAQEKAIVECRIEFQRLGNPESFFINFLVLLFIVFVLGDGLSMVQAASADPLFNNVRVALWIFLIFFAIMSGWLFYRGWTTSSSIKEMLDSINPS
jgi:hypothetical protein